MLEPEIWSGNSTLRIDSDRLPIFLHEALTRAQLRDVLLLKEANKDTCVLKLVLFVALNPDFHDYPSVLMKFRLNSPGKFSATEDAMTALKDRCQLEADIIKLLGDYIPGFEFTLNRKKRISRS
jgi:hypothetical protein